MAESTDPQDASERTKALLASLWQRNRPVIEARLEILDRAAAAHPLDAELQAASLNVAHKLAGSLGMFGFDQGTTVARQIEQLLESDPPNATLLAQLTVQLRQILFP
jgi:HPt (histidine-containing phosphotransfer) domain-containing protein